MVLQACFTVSYFVARDASLSTELAKDVKKDKKIVRQIWFYFSRIVEEFLRPTRKRLYDGNKL